MKISFPGKSNCCKIVSLLWRMDDSKYFKEYERELTKLSICSDREKIPKFFGRKQWQFFRKHVFEKHFTLS